MIVLAVCFVAVVTLYIYSTRTFNYWLKRGVKHDTPLPCVGNNLQNYLMNRSMTELAVDQYWKYPNEKIVGFFKSTDPQLIIRDPEIIKRVLSSDFYNFYPRGLNTHKVVIEPMLRNLFFADGDIWRMLRQRITPAFTSGKLKAMFPLVVERAERMQAVIEAGTTTGKSRTLDAREVMARFTTDFIGSIGFGLDSDSLNDENSAFRILGKNIFRVSASLILSAFLKQFFPELCKNMKLVRVEEDMVKLVKEILKQRNYEPSGRNDFIDLLLECRKKGTLTGESMEKRKPDGSPEIVNIELDDMLIAAQVYVFFAAGFETSSSSTSFTLHQLAYHPEVQKKVQADIDRVLAENDNKLSYDAIKEMQYLEWTFKEAMRIFPSVGVLVRKSATEYTFPELDVTIDPGIGIVIPVQALQMDPQYFKNPEEFRPERFHPDEFDKEAMKYIYLPFGEGPRACIGERLGLMQSLAGLAAILSKFSVEPAPESVRHPKLDAKTSFVQRIKGGIPLLFKKRVV